MGGGGGGGGRHWKGKDFRIGLLYEYITLKYVLVDLELKLHTYTFCIAFHMDRSGTPAQYNAWNRVADMPNIMYGIEWHAHPIMYETEWHSCPR